MSDGIDLDDLPEPEYRGEKPTDFLTVDGENPNEMSDANFDLLADRIEARGWVGGPIIANTGDLPGYDGDDVDGLIADGEHRWRAAREIGLAEVPVLLIDFEDDAERRLWRQEMNKNRGEHDPGADARDIHAILGSDSEDDLMTLVEARGEDLSDLVDSPELEGPDISTPDGEIEKPEAQHDFLVVTLEVGVEDWDDVKPELQDVVGDYDVEMEVA